jgi:hypothetical protein
MSNGEPLVWFDARSHSLVTFPNYAVDTSWGDALVSLVKDGRRRGAEVRKIDGESVSPDHPAVQILQRVGFVEGYRGWSLRD